MSREHGPIPAAPKTAAFMTNKPFKLNGPTPAGVPLQHLILPMTTDTSLRSSSSSNRCALNAIRHPPHPGGGEGVPSSRDCLSVLVAILDKQPTGDTPNELQETTDEAHERGSDDAVVFLDSS